MDIPASLICFSIVICSGEVSISRKGATEVIKEVKESSQAEEENIKPNDIITQIDDKPIENIEDYYDALANIQSGDIVLIGVTTINKSKNFSRTYSRYVAIKVD